MENIPLLENTHPEKNSEMNWKSWEQAKLKTC